MVPGLYLYRAIYNFGIMSLYEAVSWFSAAIMIIIALPLGLIFARSLPTAHSGIAHNFYIFYTNSNILTIFGIKYLFRAKTIVYNGR